MQKTKIKICGLCRDADVDYVNSAMPDYAGFIFYPKSRRYISPETAAALIKRLDKNIAAVGVFVNADPEIIAETAKTAGLDIIQLHGDESNAEIDTVRRLCPDISEVWKAVRIKDSFNADTLRGIDRADRYVADAYVEGYGGEGKRFDPRLVMDIAKEKLIVAGGLTAANLREVTELLDPYGVDMSSGVETDGRKDKAKIAEAVKAIEAIRHISI